MSSPTLTSRKAARPRRSQNPFQPLLNTLKIFSPRAWREWLNAPASEEEMTITEHLAELRARLMVSLVAVLLCTIVAFVFSHKLMEIVLAPLLATGKKVVVLGVTEGFFTQMKVALYAGIILAMPVIVYEVGAFIAPALQPNEKRWLLSLVPGATLLFILGVLFAYFVTLPAAINFLVNFIDPQFAETQPQLEKYLTFATRMVLAIGVTFEIPMFVWFLAKLKIINAKQLSGFRRYAIVIAAIFAAIITPTGDPVNMALVGVPAYLLYELGVLLARLA